MKDERYVKEVPFCGPDGRFVYEISVQTGFWFGSGLRWLVEAVFLVCNLKVRCCRYYR